MLEEYYEPSTKAWEFDSKYDQISYPNTWEDLGIPKESYNEEYISIKNYLENLGFQRYEVSNFAKHWYECRHNMAYWNHESVAAFGLSASGYIDGIRYTNSDDFWEYYKQKNICTETLWSQDIFLEKCMFGLRTWGICINKNNMRLFDFERISEFVSQWLLLNNGELLRITDTWVQYMDYILQEILL